MLTLYKYQQKAVGELLGGKRIACMPVGCLAKGTIIPLADGTTKLVQDLTSGDKLLSYDEDKQRFVANEVDAVIRSSQNPKPMIEFEYDGEKITTTYDHPFFNGDGYYPIYQLIWGALETSQRVQLKLLCKQYGQTFDDKAIWCKHCGSNEACQGRMWVLQDTDGWSNSQSSSNSRRELAEKSQQIGLCEPFKLQQDGQPSRESRVVFEKIQCLVGRNSREYKETSQLREQKNDERGQGICSQILSETHQGHQEKNREEEPLRLSAKTFPSGYSEHPVTPCLWKKIKLKTAEPYYSICMRTAPYTYCIGRKHYFITHNTGKTAVMFRWLKATGKKRIVVVTTASKAKSGDMQKEAVLWNGQEWVDSLESFDVVSWHMLDKFTTALKLTQLGGHAFAFDEIQKSKGYSSGMGKAFLRVTAWCNTWTGYTATPGDQWKDYIAYFTACKFVKNKSQFMREYCVMQTYRGFPEIVRYTNEDRLLEMWRLIATAPDTSEMMHELPPEQHRVINFKKPKNYDKVINERIRLDTGELIESTPELCHHLRQICFTKEKQEWLADFIEGLGTNCIFFCNYIEEEEKVCEIAAKALPKGAKIWRIDGHHHEIPSSSEMGKYDIVVAHYLSGGEALNFQFMNYWVSVSPHYSYSTSEQARGRIKRIGQKHSFMAFYYLWAKDTIEDDIYACLKAKSKFDEKIWAASKGIDLEQQAC